MSDKVVSASRFVPAPAGEVFSLLQRPSQHAVIDGSGTVRAARGDEVVLGEVGDTFGMDMRMGVPYRIKNTVVAFEQDREIAWRHFGRHVWRYRLESVEGGTEVTESFEWDKAVLGAVYPTLGYPEKNLAGIEKTLDNLAAHFA